MAPKSSLKTQKHYNCNHDFGGAAMARGFKTHGPIPTSEYDLTTDPPLENEMRADDDYIYRANFTGAKEVSEITCEADATNSLLDEYFTIDSPTTEYYVWFNVQTAGTDPGIGAVVDDELYGKTGVEVAIATDAADTVVAAAVATELDALGDFVSAEVGAVVTTENVASGAAPDAADGVDDGTGWTGFSTTQQGDSTSVEWTRIAFGAWS